MNTTKGQFVDRVCLRFGRIFDLRKWASRMWRVGPGFGGSGRMQLDGKEAEIFLASMTVYSNIAGFAFFVPLSTAKTIFFRGLCINNVSNSFFLPVPLTTAK